MASMALGAEAALHVFGQNVAAFECSVVLCAILGLAIGIGLGLAAYAIDKSSASNRNENLDDDGHVHQWLRS